MNDKTKGVDVLAKIDAAIRAAEFSGTDYPTPPKRAEGLREARDAVRELIDASKEYREALQEFANDGQPANFIRYTTAEKRFDAAIEKVSP